MGPTLIPRARASPQNARETGESPPAGFSLFVVVNEPDRALVPAFTLAERHYLGASDHDHVLGLRQLEGGPLFGRQPLSDVPNGPFDQKSSALSEYQNLARGWLLGEIDFQTRPPAIIVCSSMLSSLSTLPPAWSKL